MHRLKSSGGWLLLVFLMIVPVWAPLTAPGWFELHSGFLPLYHLNELAGGLPTLTAPADPWRGEGPLPYALALPWQAFGATTALKLTLALAVIAGPLGLFLAVRRLLDKPAALVASVLFAYLPFTLTALYRRGAVAEVLLLALLPWLGWAMLRVCGRPSVRRGLVVALLAAALIWTQTGLALLSLLTFSLLPLLIAASWRLRRAGWLSLALGAAAGLFSRFTWPGAFAAAPVTFADHAVYLFQLITGSSGFGLSQPGWQDDLSFAPGLAALGLALLAWWPADHADVAASTLNAWRRVWTAVAVVGLAVAVVPLPLGGLLTYPWQSLGLVGLALCGLAAVGGARHPVLHAWPLLGAWLALVVLRAYPRLPPRRVPAPPRPAPVAIYGDTARQIVLVNMETTGDLTAGGIVSATLTWQAWQPPDFDYNFYLHVLDANDQRWGQTDTQPVSGQPMTQWRVGQVITGTVAVAVSPDAPSPLHLAFGLYDWQTGARLPALLR